MLIKTTLSEADALRSFAAAVFYIGKGKKSRPYAHLKEAVKMKNKNQAMVSYHVSACYWNETYTTLLIQRNFRKWQKRGQIFKIWVNSVKDVPEINSESSYDYA